MNKLGIMVSLRNAIEDAIGVDTLVKYDGIVLPDKKPFAYIESLESFQYEQSKQRESIRKDNRYQIGLYANSLAERMSLQDDISSLLTFHEFTYYNEDGEETDKTFEVDADFSEMPIPNDDISNKTDNFRMFFDISVFTHDYRTNYMRRK